MSSPSESPKEWSDKYFALHGEYLKLKKESDYEIAKWKHASEGYNDQLSKMISENQRLKEELEAARKLIKEAQEIHGIQF